MKTKDTQILPLTSMAAGRGSRLPHFKDRQIIRPETLLNTGQDKLGRVMAA